jgi:hypothetical protein
MCLAIGQYSLRSPTSFSFPLNCHPIASGNGVVYPEYYSLFTAWIRIPYIVLITESFNYELKSNKKNDAVYGGRKKRGGDL